MINIEFFDGVGGGWAGGDYQTFYFMLRMFPCPCENIQSILTFSRGKIILTKVVPYEARSCKE